VNSLAAIALASELGISFDTARESLSRFRGADRRFQWKAEANNILVIDDYAHHPSEIEVTLQAARQGWNRRIVAIFQPHRYTRLHHLMKQFSSCFRNADLLVLTDIYAAGEQPMEGVNIETLAGMVKHPDVLLHKDLETLPEKLLSIAQSGDMLLFLGAGSITAVAERTAKRLTELASANSQDSPGTGSIQNES
jgi:UDP-N-acetylmuramate--alanine ligase